MGSRDVEEWLWISSNTLSAASELETSRPKLASHRYWEPRADVIEERHRLLIKAELPGVRPEDIQLTYLPERHAVILQGIREDSPTDETIGVHQIEILYGQFHREFRLPDVPVDAARIRASFRNGFLLIMIPKMDRIVVTHHVTIERH